MDDSTASSTSPTMRTTLTSPAHDASPSSIPPPSYIPAYPPLSRHSLSPSSPNRPTTASTSASTSPSFTSLPTTSLFSPSPALFEGKEVGLISASGGGAQAGGGGKSNRWSIQPSVEGPTKLKRQLRSRHSKGTYGSLDWREQGGVIGTGLFLGSAQSLQKAGPLGLLIAFSIMGVWVWCMMISLGEMISHLPLAGGHLSLASRLVDPAFGIATGYSYAANWLLVMPAELSAAATLIGAWSSANPAGWIAIGYVVVVLINLGGTRVYGEMEFWFCAIKFVTMVGLIVLGVVISAGGVPGTEPIGFSYYHNPGAMAQFLGIKGSLGRFAGFWAAMLQAAYSFVGTEIVSIAAGEARNPSRSLPRAVRRVIYRLMLFYVAGTFIIGLTVRYDDPALSRNDGTALSSPFVIAIERAGVQALPSVVNAAFLTAATSAASSGLYTASRCLYGLSINNQAPAVLRRLNRYGLPYVAVAVGALFGLLSFMAASHDSARVFTWLANFCSVGGVLTWTNICITYLRFHYGARAQQIPREVFPYLGPCQPYAAIFALVGFSLILLTNGFYLFIDGQWDTSDFLTRYLMLALFPILYVASRLYLRCSWPSLLELDYYSGSRDNDEVEYEEEGDMSPGEKKRTRWERVLRAFV
ncbi:hypothetical protein JCM11251_007005 [Rhodosporidiobolus azoricus]